MQKANLVRSFAVLCGIWMLSLALGAWSIPIPGVRTLFEIKFNSDLVGNLIILSFPVLEVLGIFGAVGLFLTKKWGYFLTVITLAMFFLLLSFWGLLYSVVLGIFVSLISRSSFSYASPPFDKFGLPLIVTGLFSIISIYFILNRE